ncbi:hypothetical protein DFJ74DRAFT_700185 [Hyaloraphidium curvatum]|nr:hypothetical protein DFJ74DRAFT_700185 [Hyaloraphidium curvatum]
MAQPQERNQEATCYVWVVGTRGQIFTVADGQLTSGNLDERATDALVWELFLQAGPVVNVHLPKDRVTQMHQGYGFVEYASEEDADYAIKIMNMVKFFGKPLRVNKASSDKRQIDVGANLFIGNLDPNVDERVLYDTFSQFGLIVQPPKVSRDNDTGNSKGFGFVSFDNFESSDAAIEAMNGQHLMGKPINVQYALKKDGKGERHGGAAERLIASQARKNNPNRLVSNRSKDLLGCSADTFRLAQYAMMGMGVPGMMPGMGMPGMMPGMGMPGMMPGMGMTGANNIPLGRGY